MARQLRIFNASVYHPDERGLPEAERGGSYVAVMVCSEDLKAKPVHEIRLTDAEAIRLASQLLNAVRQKNGDTR